MHHKTVIDFKELKERYLFENPLKELVARKPEQIAELLQAVEDYQRQGYYVVGYMAYEAASYFDHYLETHPSSLLQEYLAYFTVHDRVKKLPFPSHYEPVEMPTHWDFSVSKSEYAEAIAAIHEQMRQGNSYQVNYTLQLKARTQAKAFNIYNRLMIEQKAAYNAYIAHDDMAIISASPELFFKKEANQLITRPMKGTTKRGLTSTSDHYRQTWLAKDPKNRAENMMIVDLLRNDMGKICRPSSLQVKKLCEVEQYSTIWQMTSTIQGELQVGTSLLDIFRALFPCGSVTGAPKMVTMSIIKRLEKQARGVYCGAIGLCLPNGDALFNVPIRTLQIFGGQAIYGVGSGIVWDSKWQDEYREIQQKAAILHHQSLPFDLLTTAKIQNQKVLFLQEHLKRLRDSCAYFSYPFQEKLLRQKLSDLCQSLDKNKQYRLRIRISLEGQILLEDEELEPLSENFCEARLVRQEGDWRSQAFTYFKTSYRPHLSIKKYEQIYVNQAGELLETSIGNLFIEVKGELLTPPLEVGILNGIYRQYLLKNGRAKEAKIKINMLKTADKVYGANAVRGLYELKLEKK